jgi:hypothetical protein
MKKSLLLILGALFLMLVLGGCGKSSLIEGTYKHTPDETFNYDFTIVHEKKNVSVTINGKTYEAKMDGDNEILVDGKYTILESYNNANNEPDVKNVAIDNILVLNAKDWIQGDYIVDDDGNLKLLLDKQ